MHRKFATVVKISRGSPETEKDDFPRIKVFHKPFHKLIITTWETLLVNFMQIRLKIGNQF